MDTNRPAPARARALPLLSTQATARVALAFALCVLAVVQMMRGEVGSAQVATGFVMAWGFAAATIAADLRRD